MRLSYGNFLNSVTLMSGALLLAASFSCLQPAEARVQFPGNNANLVDLNGGQGRVIQAVDSRLSDRVSIDRHTIVDDDGGGFVNPIDPGNGNPGGGNPGGGNPGTGAAGNALGNTSQTSIINFTVQGGLNSVGGSTGTVVVGSGAGNTIFFVHRKDINDKDEAIQQSEGLASASSVIQLSGVLSVEGVNGRTLSVQDFISSAVNTNGIVNMTVANQLTPATNVLMTQESSVPDTAISIPAATPLTNSQTNLEPISGQGLTATASGMAHSNDLLEIGELLK